MHIALLISVRYWSFLKKGINEMDQGALSDACLGINHLSPIAVAISAIWFLFLTFRIVLFLGVPNQVGKGQIHRVQMCSVH